MKDTELGLDEAVRIEDALDSIMRGFSREIHVASFRKHAQEENGVAFDDAVSLVAELGSVRKAQNHISKVIGIYR